MAQPALAIRAARDAVKVERAGGLVHLARDVGRVQGKAGTQAALDGLKIAETPREMAASRLAEKSGRSTRAILKVAGRGAIALTRPPSISASGYYGRWLHCSDWCRR